METDKDAPKKTRKVKKQVRKGDLPISTGSASLDDATKASLLEKESAMVMEDKLVADTEEKKNELEAYIYDLRAKLDEQYSEFASDEEKETIKAKLEATEVRSRLHHSEMFCTDLYCRTGCTRRARTPVRVCTLPRSTRSVPWPAQLSSATLRKSRPSVKPLWRKPRPTGLRRRLRRMLARLQTPRRPPPTRR
jgi:hypothetical protein